MNKMNLPAPFGPQLPLPPSFASVNVNPIFIKNTKRKKSANDVSESESESDSEAPSKIAKASPPPTPTLPQEKNPPTHIPPETITSTEPKKIQLQFSDKVPLISQPAPKKETKDKEKDKKQQHISLKELMDNKAPDEELIQKFTNYSEGEPSSKLYIKNLKKRVTVEDLIYVFGRYSEEETPLSGNDIKLMKEGRMKGQAFITFQSKESAAKALREVHGYLLHGKPICVSFGKPK
eukprot:TRINITY_DN3582_c0_g1_i1.p1 TRINITY_DN3582_c0_g1~~TRINITY_DN3582_c0_g1_i1.p1  ORF type:complete len:235 (+),score=62.09 TRINITY_DN3582_c0_g1_i1:590-1294(+)